MLLLLLRRPLRLWVQHASLPLLQQLSP